MEDIKQISILGCGWLGFTLAKQFIEAGYKVKGATTTKEKVELLANHNILPFVIQLTESKVEGNIEDFLEGSDTLIINIPPGLRQNPKKNHLLEIENLLRPIENSDVKKVLYISSTSVYPDSKEFPSVNEKLQLEPSSENGKQLMAIEKRLLNYPSFKTTIIRFGGLFGEDRHPATYLSGRKNIKNPNAPVNLIHREDCIAIIQKIIHNNHWNQILNASIPDYPTKKDYYSSYCKRNLLPLPNFDDNTASVGKKVDSNKMVQLLDYRFKHAL